jgi:dihydrofolate reductase
MRRVIVFESVTLDGVMQAPGRPDEDRRDGFEHGGWAAPYADPAMGRMAGESMGNTDGILLGRRTYEDFFTTVLNNTQKYVASTTLEEPLPWMNSTLLEGDAARSVAALKEQPGKDLVMLGSGELARSLMRNDLVDEYVLLIHPLVLGSGRHLFADDGSSAALQLVGTTTMSTGVVVATYRPAEPAAGSADPSTQS